MTHISPSVLVIRLDAIGDALALTPLLAALREQEIPVDLVMRAVNADVFSSSATRNVFIAPFAVRSGTRANLEAIRDFGKSLRGNGYTHVLVATEDPGGYRLANAIGAPYSVGFSNGWGKPLKTVWVRSLVNHIVVRSAGLDPRAPHEAEVLFSLGRSLLGNDMLPSSDPSVLRPLVLEREPSADGRVAFQVSDKWERLGIPLDEVVASLREIAKGGDVHAIASEKETAYAARIESASGIRVERYADLEPWKEAIARARALVAPDSGAVHVAGMVGTPTVAVFPPIAAYGLQTARWAPWAAPYRLIRSDAGWPRAAAGAVTELI
jgi:ADP-heptose:LPS heptosyltransferase